MNAMLAISWEPELRGILIVIIAVTVLVGSIYLILGTNVGARLGFLITLSALAGWMFIMGAIWWSYGKGLLGTDPTWQPVGGRTVLQEPRALREANVLKITVPDADDPTDTALGVQSAFVDEDWLRLDAAAPQYQQAFAAASVFLEEDGALAAGEFTVVNVFDKGGERSPQFWGNNIDFLAFFHKPHYSVVEVAPLVVQRDEPGRAPARPVIDTTRPHQYVYMIRDMGSKRRPAAFITIGSLITFLALCSLLHRRDRRVTLNRALVAAKA